jgi:hypothetical protein
MILARVGCVGRVERSATALALIGLASGLVHCHRSSDSTGPAGGAASSSSTPLPLAASLAFLESFEGEIDLALTDKEKGETTPTPLDVLVKTGKVRLDLPEKLTASSGLGSGYGILDTASKKAALVSDARKEVMVIDLNTSGEKLKGLGTPPPGHPGATQAPEPPKTTLTKTGKTDTVAGYKCENWDVTSDHREATVCVSEQGASWFQIPLTGIPTERLWMAELLDGKHFPLRLIGYDKTGNTESGRIEVTKIEKKPLAASQFEYPPAYRVIDLGQMLGAMRGLAGAGGPGERPGSPPGMAGLPPGMTLPPGVKLPPGVTLPPGMGAKPGAPHAQ